MKLATMKLAPCLSLLGLASWLCFSIAAVEFQTAAAEEPAATDQQTASQQTASSILAAGAELQLLSDQFKFTEGPTTDAAGNVYFTDQPNDAIHMWTTDGTLQTFLQPAGRSNGLYFDADGLLWACADAKNQLWSIDAEGQHRVWVDAFEDKLLNGPNDLWIHSGGAIYFTDPFYKRPYWDPTRGPSAQPSEAVYRLSAARDKVVKVADDFRRPNGIIGDAAGKLLYVADIGAGKTYRFTIADDGSLTERTLFCSAGSDGMTIDNLGNVYLTGGAGVTVYDPTGKQLEVIAVPQRWTANVTFGGPDRDTLFITAGTSLYSIKTRVKGL